MAGIRLVLCIHNHQPVGNFDHVIEGCYRDAYLPFLDVIERHPTIPWVLHNSGCLWEWLESRHPEYLARIERLVASGQMELLGGGFYEPVLPALGAEDRRGQILRMRAYLRERFGVEPRGLWLTERVWEPGLPEDLCAAGVDYLPLDDTQFLQAGVAPERLRGAFTTESGGRVVRLFPALMELRYRIPFADPAAVVDWLRQPFAGGGDGLAVYADDGEKFGSWPGTHDLVYRRGWLDRFLTALAASAERVEVTTFARECASHDPLALVYLPAGSYAEMGQWALPPQMQAAYVETRRRLSEAGAAREADLFVRGGFWRNFFARYPESGWMHLRAHVAGERARAMEGRVEPATWERARDHLWRAQCNCAYWHGVFGGLYLPHLRQGIFEQLIAGESVLQRAAHGGEPWVAAYQAELDGDGAPEIVLENDQLALFFTPRRGGRLMEWDDRAAATNLLNVLARRPEHYHAELGAAPPAGEARAETIHARVHAKEEGLDALLLYDAHARAGLGERTFREAPSGEGLSAGRPADCGDFLTQPYEWRCSQDPEHLELRLWRRGTVTDGERRDALGIAKTVRLERGAREFRVDYEFSNPGPAPLRLWVAIENHFNLLSAQGPERHLTIVRDAAERLGLDATCTMDDVAGIALCDERRGLRVALDVHPRARLCCHPVHTVSLSERGAEKNYQGLACVLAWFLDLEPGGLLATRLRFGSPRRAPAGEA